jgi:tRNA (guanosine-2'-O-)-methyltransferase
MKERKIHPDNAILAELDQLADTRRARIESVVENRQRGLMVVMEDVDNPYNLAAISRSCDAFGIQTIAYTVAPERAFDPQKEGGPANTSASKWLDYRMFTGGTTPALTALKQEGWHLLATVADANAPALHEVDLTAPAQLAVLVGNELRGLSNEALQQVDSRITIPMLGMIQSFNVSVATAIILYEIVRQRRASGQDFGLTPDEQQALLLDFAQRAKLSRHRAQRHDS